MVSSPLALEPGSGSTPERPGPLRSFLGLPLHSREGLVGLVGLANGTGGYDATLLELLQPLQATCCSLLVGLRNEQRRRQAEEELRQAQERLLAADRHGLAGHAGGGRGARNQQPAGLRALQPAFVARGAAQPGWRGALPHGARCRRWQEVLREAREGADARAAHRARPEDVLARGTTSSRAAGGRARGAGLGAEHGARARSGTARGW